MRQISEPEVRFRARPLAVAAGEAKPITDVRGTAEFRSELVEVLTRRMVAAARDRASGKQLGRRVAA